MLHLESFSQFNLQHIKEVLADYLEDHIKPRLVPIDKEEGYIIHIIHEDYENDAPNGLTHEHLFTMNDNFFNGLKTLNNFMDTEGFKYSHSYYHAYLGKSEKGRLVKELQTSIISDVFKCPFESLTTHGLYPTKLWLVTLYFFKE